MGPGVVPDATKPTAWRRAVGYGYYGVLQITIPFTYALEHVAATGLNTYLTYDALGIHEHLDPDTAEPIRRPRHPRTDEDDR